MTVPRPYRREMDIFKGHGGLLRTSRALKLGVHPRDLYGMRETGLIEPIARGFYRLADLPPFSKPDLITVALRVPQGVICLISALALHEITTQIPHEVHIALLKGAERPRLDFPPLRCLWFSGKAYSEGIEMRKMDGLAVKVYSPEKTVADSFKFRNRVGLDVAIEALKLGLEKRRCKPNTLLRYARICRVERVMRPYLEALL